jgi:hypothetical protein
MKGLDPQDDSVNTDHTRYQTPRRYVSNSPPLDQTLSVARRKSQSPKLPYHVCGSHLFSHGIHMNTKTLPPGRHLYNHQLHRTLAAVLQDQDRLPCQT